MTWFRVDDGFYDHPKVLSLPRGTIRKGAIALWTNAGSRCARYLLDGMVADSLIEDLGCTKADARALVACGLWHEHGHDCNTCPDIPKGHYLYHQWPEYQYTREQVEAEREATRKRQERYRKGRHDAVDNVSTNA